MRQKESALVGAPETVVHAVSPGPVSGISSRAIHRHFRPPGGLRPIDDILQSFLLRSVNTRLTLIGIVNLGRDLPAKAEEGGDRFPADQMQAWPVGKSVGVWDSKPRSGDIY
ncbi:MAG: hypothetical protein E6Q98_06055 [Rhodospirillaceae bacterium]|nr:MAG: hypothetical protein E6Q98_06055 [Rhodospirillaceae bacterium]